MTSGGHPPRTASRVGDKEHGEIQIDEERLVYSNRYGSLYDDAVSFPSGARGTYVRFAWHTPYTVAVLPVLDDGSVVLLSVFRHAARAWTVEIPKGFGAADRSPEETARIELFEEAGVESARLRLTRTVAQDPAFIATPCHLFIADGCTLRDARRLEASEAIRAPRVVLATDVDRLIDGGEVTDAITLLLLMMHSSARSAARRFTLCRGCESDTSSDRLNRSACLMCARNWRICPGSWDIASWSSARSQ